MYCEFCECFLLLKVIPDCNAFEIRLDNCINAFKKTLLIVMDCINALALTAIMFNIRDLVNALI